MAQTKRLTTSKIAPSKPIAGLYYSVAIKDPVV